MATAALIDHTNYDAFLVQSTQGRAGTPDGNIFFDMANNLVEVITASELANVDFGHASGAIQINVVASAGTYSRLTGSFLTDGFRAGQSFAGASFSNGGNNVTKVISTVTALVITVTDNTGLVDETGGGSETVSSVSEANPMTDALGITLRGLYNFENQERRTDETLRTFLRASRGIYRFAGAFAFVSGNKLAADDREKIRGSAWIEYSDTAGTLVDRIYHGILSLNPIEGTTQAYYALVADTLEATLQAATWVDYGRLGPVDEAIQVFGSTANGDSGAGNFDDTLKVLVTRARSWGNNFGETTSIATNITEFSGFSAGYGLGETVNTANVYALADVFGGSQVSPWTGMSLEKLVAAQTETGFNESDGDFTWVLANTLSGTKEQCAAFLDALGLQDTDIDDGAGSYNGRKGRVWYTRDAQGNIVTASIGGEGLFIEGLSTAEKQGIIFTDDAAATKTYPFNPDVRVSVGAQAVADVLAWYHAYYVDGAATADFDTATAVPVRDKDLNVIKGNVSTDAVGEVISFPYAYLTDTDAGLTANTDKDIVFLVEGDGSAGQAITYFTITNDAIVSATCAPSADNNA